MKPRPPVPKKSAGRWRAVALAGAAVFLLFWWVRDDALSEVVAPAVPAPPPAPAPAAMIPVAEALVALPDAATAVVLEIPDAAVSIAKPAVDAGASEQFRIEQIMLRWSEALAPLFRPRASRANKPARVIVASGEAKEPAAPEPQCENRETHYPLHGLGTVDFLVAIDTSGSMAWVLADVVRWLGNLELGLRERGVDFTLIVVADHRSLNEKARRERDGGQIQALIGSSDAMETLIRSARQGKGTRWPQLLRSGSVKHLVVVTDDEANDIRGLPYLGALIDAAEGSLGTPEAPNFRFHLVGGFEPPNPEQVLTWHAPLVTATCSKGQAPGLAYQQLAQERGGTRSSLCYPASFQAVGRALVEWPVFDGTRSCVWLMRPGSVVVSAYAERMHGTSRKLWETRTASSCFGRKDSYLSSGQIFALCDATCGGLSDDGFDSVNVLVRCEPQPASP
jgi:hypothetical protein